MKTIKLLKVNSQMVEQLINGQVSNIVLGGNKYVLKFNENDLCLIDTINDVFIFGYDFNSFTNYDDMAYIINNAIYDFLETLIIKHCDEYWEVVENVYDLNDKFAVIARCEYEDDISGVIEFKNTRVGIFEKLKDALKKRDKHKLLYYTEVDVYLMQVKTDEQGQKKLEYTKSCFFNQQIKVAEEQLKKYNKTKKELYKKTYKLTLEKLKNYIAIGKDFRLTEYKNIFIFNCDKINDYIGNCDNYDAIYTMGIIDDTFDTYDNDEYDELTDIVSSAIDDAIWENEGEIGYSVTYAEFDDTYYFEII